MVQFKMKKQYKINKANKKKLKIKFKIKINNNK